MPQAVLYNKSFWTREEVTKDSSRIYLFGDNTWDRISSHHVPRTTQAVIRGLPNAVGIDTKRNRGGIQSSYLTDKFLDRFKIHVDEQIELAKSFNKIIVVPSSGIGTGKVQLPMRAPKCYQYLADKLNELLGYIYF